MPEIVLPNNFKPRRYQSGYMNYLDDGGKRAVVILHRRAGKDLGDLHQTSKMMHEVIGNYWHFLPTSAQARKTIWEGRDREGRGFIDWAFPKKLVRRTNNTEMLVELRCGSIWRLMGSDQSEFVGGGPKKITFSEFALCKPTVWDYARPMLRENNGVACFLTTPRGKNHAYDIYRMARETPGWFHILKTVRDTDLRYASTDGVRTDLTWREMVEEERREGMHEALIKQEYFCDFEAANVGAVWGALIVELEQEERYDVDFEHERDGVCTSWDLGLTDSTAIWLWRVRGDGLEFVDYYEKHGKPIGHYLSWLEERAETMGYSYDHHYLPHDAKAKTLVTGTSVLDEAISWSNRHKRSARPGQRKMGDVRLTPRLSLQDGIQAGRRLLQRRGTRFHSRCNEEQGLAALKQYQHEWDPEKKTFGDEPLHDWSSHGADGFRYAGVVHKLEVDERGRALEKCLPPEQDPVDRELGMPRRLVTGADRSLSLNSMWEDRERQLRQRRRRDE